jgi:hypothetical protein
VNFEFESEICKKIFYHIKENYEEGKSYPLVHYLHHTDAEISSFAISNCQQDAESLMDWNKNKKNKNLKIKQYGENYRLEVDQILQQVKIAYLEKLGKQIMTITRQAIGENLEYNEDAKKYLLVQLEYLELFKELRENSNYVFRKLIK